MADDVAGFVSGYRPSAVAGRLKLIAELGGSGEPLEVSQDPVLGVPPLHRCLGIVARFGIEAAFEGLEFYTQLVLGTGEKGRDSLLLQGENTDLKRFQELGHVGFLRDPVEVLERRLVFDLKVRDPDPLQGLVKADLVQGGAACLSE